MNWKISFIAVISLTLIALPVNLISCIQGPDPFDQYASFFHNDLASTRSFRPFYYVNSLGLYQQAEPDTTLDEACADWARYYGHGLTTRQVHSFICQSELPDLEALYVSLKTDPSTPIPRWIRATTRLSPMARIIQRNRDTAALRYIVFARNTEPLRVGDDIWEPNRWTHIDSLSADQLIAEANSRYRQTRSPFIRMRYAYQATSMNFYNFHPQACIQTFESCMTDPKAAGSLYAEALAFKAGALYRQHKNYLAAYTYSRAFAISKTRVRKFQSFKWCINTENAADLATTLALCRNAGEKANLIGMFNLSNPSPAMGAMKSCYAQNPATPILEVLALREVNKLEENEFSPRLHRRKGGMILYLQEEEPENVTIDPRWRKEALTLAPWYEEIARNPAVPNQALFATAAAHVYYILGEYEKANTALNRAATLPASEKLRDQQHLTRLLITLSQMKILDAAAEEQLLPSVRWLENKAIAEGKGHYHPLYNYHSISLWQQFYRNFLSEIIAKKYHAQGNRIKEILCTGAAEKITLLAGPEYGYLGYAAGTTREYIQANFTATQLQELWQHIYPPVHSSPWDRFLANHFPVSKQDLIETRSIAYTREYQWQSAIDWLEKLHDTSAGKLTRNPFVAKLRDYQDTVYPEDKGHFDRINFLHTMKMLSEKDKTGKATADDLYKLASGYYNMTHVGRAWELVCEIRNGPTWHGSPPVTTAFKNDYYGCYTAEKYYRKAMSASSNKEFKAKCLFMMAKCAQTQGLEDRYFPTLVKDYNATAFYREAFNTCSYLRDFVKKESVRH